MDLDEIHTWLVDEDRRDVDGNFLCNWSLIEKAHKERRLLVFVDGKSSASVAFQMNGLVKPGILQVRESHRNKGIGRKMVERCLSLAIKSGNPLLYVECNPTSSIPFWKRMGFSMIESAGVNQYAYRVVDMPIFVPEHGGTVSVQISFYPQSDWWNENTKPYAAHVLPGKRADDGTIYLSRRIHFHTAAFAEGRDVIVEIEVDSLRRLRCLAAYPESAEAGVMNCKNGVFIDRVLPSEF